jgi:hypothetical protein
MKHNPLFLHWLYSPLEPWPLIFSSMVILQTVVLLGRVISSSQALYLNTGKHIHIPNIHVGFEPTIPASERASDSSATLTGCLLCK